MVHEPRPLSSPPAPLLPPADRWLKLFRSACASAEGGVVRRRIADVEAMVGRERFLDEVRRHGWRVASNAGHFVVFCNRAPVVLLGD